MPLPSEDMSDELLQSDVSVPSDEALHATIESICTCGVCAARSLSGASDTATSSQSETAAADAALPSEASILAAMQFELTSLTDTQINTTSDTAWNFTYQFETTEPDDLPTNSTYTGWTTWTGAEKAAMRDALAHIETLLNVTFTEVAGDSDPDINFGKVDLPGSLAGYGGFRYQSVSYDGGNTWEMYEYDGYAVFDNALNLADYTSLLLHEMGHVLTLKHPFEGVTIEAGYDNNKWSVMSYATNPETGTDGDVMQLFDTYALQDRWGANDQTNLGATIYTGPRTTTTDVIYDAGGRWDWLDAKDATNDVVLDLNPGEYSSFGTRDDVVIALDTWIEHARGGAGDDVINGNRQGNVLIGGAGDDVIYGNWGKDEIRGQQGDDILYGGDRQDILEGDQGNDTLYGGRQADSLYGGRGRDTLDGGRGDDLLWGGAGRDAFYFTEASLSDTIMDFEDDLDRIFFDMDGVTTRYLAKTYAYQDGNDLVFDFGDNDVLRILNMTLEQIENDLHVV